MKEIHKIMFSLRMLRIVLITVSVILISLFMFEAGMVVEFRKASFGKSWDEHYLDNFGPRRHGPLGAMPDEFPAAHGTIGTVVRVALPTLVVAGPDNAEKVIVISDDTQIRRMRDTLAPSDLVPSESVVVIGDPNADGQIRARFIRILPQPGEPATIH